ncbi:MAG TPA: DUF5908 family protein [Flavitalea sp.]|nr:DUF5908 family protein [Flavitalea sp.]
MPVEILELIVRANVQEQGSSSGVPAVGDHSGTEQFQKQVLIEECVEQVLEIIRRREER